MSLPSNSPRRRSSANLLLTFLVLAALAVLIVDRVGIAPALGPALTTGYQWLMVLAGVALLIGVANVLALHLWRVQAGQRDWVLSLVLVAVLVAVFVAGVVNPAGANSPLMSWVFDALVAPSQSALFSLLIFFMAAAAFRYLRVSRPGGVWMLAGALIVLLAQWPLAAQWLPPAYIQATFWLVDAPVMAALRGVLLGSGIALLVVGLRLLVGKA
jgi:hypothetical protein